MTNWKDGIKPGSNNVDYVYLSNDCPDEPQEIILDEPVWIYAIYCTATGNRHYTLTPAYDETIRIGYYYGLNGSTSRTVDLTINADILIGALYTRVYCYGGFTILNGAIRPSPSEQTSVYLAPYNNPGWLSLGASNNISELRFGGEAKIILNHPHAAASGGYLRTGSPTVLVQTNHVILKRIFLSGDPMVVGVHSSLARQDIDISIGYTDYNKTITILPRNDGSTFTVNLTGAAPKSRRQQPHRTRTGEMHANRRRLLTLIWPRVDGGAMREIRSSSTGPGPTRA